MSQETYDRILANPRFKELTASRNRFAWILSFIMLGVYYTFVGAVAFHPESFSSPLAEGLTWTVGLVGGFIIQMFCFVMTGIYVGRANTAFDRLNREIIEEAYR